MSSIPTDDPIAFRRSLNHWFKGNARCLPWRENRSPYYVVVSEFMLQQTQVKTVIPYFQNWMTLFPHWQALAQAKEDHVLKAWEGLGYYSRARNLHQLAKTLEAEHSGTFPRDPQQMRQLPGIGPYTAGAVASLAFGQSVPLIDGNVERVFSRLFDIQNDIKATPNQKKLWSLAAKLIPQKKAGAFNESLMELGALICSPKSPQCLICPVKKFCTAPNPEKLPIRVKKKTIKLDVDYALIIKDKKVWLLNPEEPGRWKGFHRLPEFDPEQMIQGEKRHHMTFSITKYRIAAQLFSAQWKNSPSITGSWTPLSELKSLPLPTPVRKMLNNPLTLYKI